MTTPGYRQLQDEIAALRSRLFALSGELPEAARPKRARMLREMWELSGEIAEANQRSANLTGSEVHQPI